MCIEPSCRRRAILSYFGESINKKATLCCDACSDPKGIVDSIARCASANDKIPDNSMDAEYNFKSRFDDDNDKKRPLYDDDNVKLAPYIPSNMNIDQALAEMQRLEEEEERKKPKLNNITRPPTAPSAAVPW